MLINIIALQEWLLYIVFAKFASEPLFYLTSIHISSYFSEHSFGKLGLVYPTHLTRTCCILLLNHKQRKQFLHLCTFLSQFITNKIWTFSLLLLQHLYFSMFDLLKFLELLILIRVIKRVNDNRFIEARLIESRTKARFSFLLFSRGYGKNHDIICKNHYR